MNHFYLGPSFLYFWRTALRRFSQCFFFNFSSSANNGGWNFYSARIENWKSHKQFHKDEPCVLALIGIANQKQNWDEFELAKEKRGHFLYRLFCPKDFFFNICVLSQCIVHWIHFQNIYTFTCQKTLLYTFFCLFLKSS